MTLFEITIAALLSVARPPAVDVVADRTRLEAMAAAIAGAVETADDPLVAAWLGEPQLPLTGHRAREATALALVAIAAHESALRADVADCRRTGDHGRSITTWQLMRGRSWGRHTRRELCSSVAIAARQALAVFAGNGARASTAGGLFASYAGGRRPSRASREMCRLWERLTRAAGIDASCSRRSVR